MDVLKRIAQTIYLKSTRPEKLEKVKVDLSPVMAVKGGIMIKNWIVVVLAIGSQI